MTPIDRILAMEEIKAVKARYFRHLDTKHWAEFGKVFTADATLEVAPREGDPGRKETGAPQILAWVSSALADAITVHHGHMPEIEILSPDRASAIWAMDDIVIWKDRALHGWGHYHETYRREVDGWRIASSRLTRLRVKIRSRD